MSPRVDLVWLGRSLPLPAWPLGQSRAVEPNVAGVAAAVRAHLAGSTADAWLFWDGALGPPNLEAITRAFALPGDLWHAGLWLGTAQGVGLLDAISPAWMLGCDPDPNREATSWRLSLRACLTKTAVLRQLGFVRSSFQTLAGAALEFGHRCVSRGVIPRHVPWLAPPGAPHGDIPLALEDELRFVWHRFGLKWSHWALLRAVLRGTVSPLDAALAARQVFRGPRPAEPPVFQRDSAGSSSVTALPDGARVTVLIPTVDRYPYLRTLLDQLRRQTVRPLEIIVVDQTPADRRDGNLAVEFADLPLRVLYQDEAGQCVSRNAGLQIARGDHVLFIDDDDEVGPGLIEAHLRTLARFRADVSSGVADEVGAGPLPANFTFPRASDVFPTNNTLIRKSVLHRSGLFDLAYNRGARADGDLGMRVYLSGAVMVLNPAISVLHHHASAGGLRTHRARVVTYASSRARLTHRAIPSATEVYLTRRYFPPAQLREMLWISVLGTFSIRGGWGRKLLKAAISLACLPHTLWCLRERCLQAGRMLKEFPKIPRLTEESTGAGGRVAARVTHTG